MKAELGRWRSLYNEQSVLIFDLNDAPCAALKCDSLFPLLRKSLPVKCIQEQTASPALDKLSSDSILLGRRISEAVHDLTKCQKQNVGFS
jgi:hypothetical protein